MQLAWIQNSPEKTTGPIYAAEYGLQLLGYTCKRFSSLAEIDFAEEGLVVAYINTVRDALRAYGKAPPPNIDYPEQLKSCLARTITSGHLGSFTDQVASEQIKLPVFIKPKHVHKAFPGRVVHSFRDLVDTSLCPKDMEIYVSTLLKFESEYRVFVSNKEVVGCRHYKNDPLVFPSGHAIRTMVSLWKSAPRAYCLDVGVHRTPYTEFTFLVEINDAHSAGDYGLDPLIYARWVETRWCELTGFNPIP